jgi:Tol biopolymer transport system component
VFAPTVNSALQKVSASGGVPTSATSLTTGETSHRRPSFLPDGRRFLFSANAAGAGQRPEYLAAVDSPDPTELLMSDSANALYSQGHVLYLRGTTLMAHPFDAQRVRLTGEPIPVAEEVQRSGVIANGIFSVSDSGVLVYSTGNSVAGQLTWLDRAGKQLGFIGDRGAYSDLELAPDGKRASVTLPDPSRGGRDIWIFDTDRGVRSRFSFDPADESSSAWSPDGSELIFSSDRKGHVDLYRKLSNGAGSEESLFEDDRTKWIQSWSPDGSAVLFFTGAAEGTDLFVLPLSGARTPTPLQQTPFNETRGRFSPDGRWVAYQSNESGRAEVYVTPLAAGGGKWQISTAGGAFPRWRRDGAEIFFLGADNRMMAASANGRGSSFVAGAVTPLFQTRVPTGGGYHYDVSADGQRFLVNSLRETDSTPFTVVVNWIAGLKE